ncbi:MAG TPA: transketolase C-terminal domain-containing protein, partial [Pirellulales bacterium]|nr:transketolase C-terminal domain-containing protein [Pirellulales bacterium]
ELMSLKGMVPEEPYEIEFGRASVVRSGSDATVVAMALMVHRSLAAAEKLAADGVSIEVIDPRTVSPLDIDTVLDSVAKTGRLLIVDEAYGPCSMAAEIAARVAEAGFQHLRAPVRRLNGAFAPTPYSPPLEAAVTPQIDDIGRAVRDLVNV